MTGHLVFAARRLMVWLPKLQPTIAASLMKAEYTTAFNAIQKFEYVKGC